MPLQATSGAASYDAFGGGVAAVPNYIEECFSAFLYTGNGFYPSGGGQTIVNGIDLSTKGGLVWIKSRNDTTSHGLYDTARGINQMLGSNNTNQQYTDNAMVSANSNGFTLGAESSGWTRINLNGNTYASWTFRKQPKFFDVVTYTGNGTAGRQIAHNLGSVPGCIIVKRTDTSGYEWEVYHRSLGNTKALWLNSTTAAFDFAIWNNTDPTSTNFTVGGQSDINGGGGSATYVAYLFAHNAGGFGLTGTDNVISCGSFTPSGGEATVNLGYEPQWILWKNADGAYPWFLLDNMRGIVTDGDDQRLVANSANAEGAAEVCSLTSTGFKAIGQVSGNNYIYIAIRRGPMKVPTSGTSVFAPVLRTGTSAAANVSTGNTPDWVIIKQQLGSSGNAYSRLQGPNRQFYTESTLFEVDQGVGYGVTSFLNTSFNLGLSANGENQSGRSLINWTFSRAPSFFDEVCYTGTGATNNSQPHNLGVVPELIIVKRRSGAASWQVYSATYGRNFYAFLDLTQGFASDPGNAWGTTDPTSTTFSLSPLTETNASGSTYVAYLFASCPGVSKVGSYTGTGTTQTINCGFTGGARFVMIKRTDSTGDWYVWDTARGIVSGNDPYLLLNSTAAEVTSTDYVDTYSAGFEISSTAPAAINASGGSFIFLAIA